MYVSFPAIDKLLYTMLVPLAWNPELTTNKLMVVAVEVLLQRYIVVTALFPALVYTAVAVESVSVALTIDI